MKCEKCNTNKDKSKFAPTTSKFFPSGHINICFPCVNKHVSGDDLNQVDRFLQHCNIAFYPNEWRKIWKREPHTAFHKYTHTHYDLKYTKYDWGEQNEKLKDVARKGVIDSELEELSPFLIQELKIKWGDLPEIDLIRLERYYNASLSDYNVSTEVQRDILRKICRLSLIIDSNLTEGKIDKDAITQYDKLMNSALKTLETSQSEGITSVSEVVAFIEQNGFQPKFYTGIPRDELDLMEQNSQEYLRDLILGEVNLTDLYEARKRLVEGEESDVEKADDI